ncbi:MAG: hemolysin family protein [Flavobacterium sp.]
MVEVFVIVVCLILSAFFSGMEIAYVSSNKVYLSIEKMQDNFSASILTRITQRPSRFIAAMLVGNNIALVVYGFFMGDLIMGWVSGFSYPLSDVMSLLVQTIISTLIILITAEFLPKVFFQIYANEVMKWLSFPAYVFYVVLFPISEFIIRISDTFLRIIFKTAGDKEQLLFSKVELGNYISEQMDGMEDKEGVDSEIQIFQNALEFSGVKVRDIMNPRTEIVAVEIHDTMELLKSKFIETGYSKILVFQNSMDDIIGYVHSFDLFKKPKTIKSVVKSVEYVPETMLIKDVLDLLTKKRKSVAVILDEYGGTSGMATIEDIVEELFGEIEDEHDEEEVLPEEMLSENSYRFSAKLKVDYLNETYKLNIPESDSYSTLGGYIVSINSEIPQSGEEVKTENYSFLIEQGSQQKIDVVLLTLLES